MEQALNVVSGLIPSGISAGFLIGLVIVVAIFLAKAYRRVVEPNEVHIVQSSKGTRTYGKVPAPATAEGDTAEKVNNSYYSWPAWWPRIGVQVKVLPLSVFKLPLTNYEAYDIGKVPFMVDVVSFYRIEDPRIAAKRIDTLEELERVCAGQLT